jgi:hypothetical protein
MSEFVPVVASESVEVLLQTAQILGQTRAPFIGHDVSVVEACP